MSVIAWMQVLVVVVIVLQIIYLHFLIIQLDAKVDEFMAHMYDINKAASRRFYYQDKIVDALVEDSQGERPPEPTTREISDTLNKLADWDKETIQAKRHHEAVAENAERMRQHQDDDTSPPWDEK